MSGAFPPPVRRAILVRDDGACVSCGRHVVDPTSGTPYGEHSIQHRRARGMGGTKDPLASSVANGVLLCGSATTGCHGRVESNPAWATDHGYRIPQGADPRLLPVWQCNRGMTFLTATGEYSPLGPNGEQVA